MNLLLQSVLPWGAVSAASFPLRRLDSVELAKVRLQKKHQEEERQRQETLEAARRGADAESGITQTANNLGALSVPSLEAPVELSGAADFTPCPSTSFTASQSANINSYGAPIAYVPQLPPSSASDEDSVSNERQLRRLLDLRPDSLLLAKMRLAKQHEGEQPVSPGEAIASGCSAQPARLPRSSKRPASGHVGGSDPRTRQRASSRRAHSRRASEGGSASGGEGPGSAKSGARSFFGRLKATFLGQTGSASDQSPGPSKSAKSTHSLMGGRDTSTSPQVRGTSIDMHDVPQRALRQVTSLPVNAYRPQDGPPGDAMSVGSGAADNPLDAAAIPPVHSNELLLLATSVHVAAVSQDSDDDAVNIVHEEPWTPYGNTRSSLRASAPATHIQRLGTQHPSTQQRLFLSPPHSSSGASGLLHRLCSARSTEVGPVGLLTDADFLDDYASFSKVRLEGLSTSSRQSQQGCSPLQHQQQRRVSSQLATTQLGLANLGAVCEGTVEEQGIPGAVNN